MRFRYGADLNGESVVACLSLTPVYRPARSMDSKVSKVAKMLECVRHSLTY